MNLFIQLVFFINKVINFGLKWILPAKIYALYSGVNMGKNCIISSKLIGSEPFLITLGNNVHVTSRVQFITHDGAVHVFRHKCKNFDVFGKIIIGDNTYIGNNVIILPGIIIGKNCIIGANSVVTKSIPDDCLVGGNPAHYICSTSAYWIKMTTKNAQTKGMRGRARRIKILDLPESKLISKDYIKC